MTQSKSSNTSVHRLMLYRRALHPELFELEARRSQRQPEYETECWVVPGGHVVRFHFNGENVTETVLESGDHLPEHGLIHALPCLGEKDYEFDPEGKIGYVTTIQTENLADNLYMSTFREMRDFANEVNALCFEWEDPDNGSPCFSLIDTQNYKREFHLQSYHLLGSGGLVLRTQSIFEML